MLLLSIYTFLNPEPKFLHSFYVKGSPHHYKSWISYYSFIISCLLASSSVQKCSDTFCVSFFFFSQIQNLYIIWFQKNPDKKDKIEF